MRPVSWLRPWRPSLRLQPQPGRGASAGLAGHQASVGCSPAAVPSPPMRIASWPLAAAQELGKRDGVMPVGLDPLARPARGQRWRDTAQSWPSAVISR